MNYQNHSYPIFQKPLITFALDHLIATGIRRFVVNTHRLPHLFEHQFSEKNYRGRPLDLVNEPELLETGGGIKNAEPLLREGDFLTYSGDILTDIPLSSLIAEHFRAGNDATLALRETGFKPSIAFLEGRIVDIGERFGIAGDYDFANIAVWGRKIFQRIPQRKISFIPVLLDWIREGGKIGGVVLNEGKWLNIGSSAQYVEAHRMISSEKWSPDFIPMTPVGRRGSRKARRLTPLRNCAASPSWAPIARLARTRLCRTQLSGPVHKLLPEVNCKVVLSARSRGPRGSCKTPSYENGTASSPDPPPLAGLRRKRN